MMNENKMDDITDCCINADDVYECFICNIKFKHNNKDRFKKHLLTKGHVEKEKKIGLCLKDVVITNDLYQRIISFYGIAIAHKYKLMCNDNKSPYLLRIINETSKKYEIYEYEKLQSWENKVNNDYTNYRISLFQVKNKETNDILTISYDTYFIEGLLNAYTFYKDIKDFELKLICDIVFNPCVIYPIKHRPRYESLNYPFHKNIVLNEYRKRMKLKHYIYFHSPYWGKDVGSIIDSYI